MFQSLEKGPKHKLNVQGETVSKQTKRTQKHSSLDKKKGTYGTDNSTYGNTDRSSGTPCPFDACKKVGGINLINDWDRCTYEQTKEMRDAL